jgi:type II secretory pathway component PulF
METDAACRELFTDCPESRTADIALEYARNNTRWHEDFGPAFQILIEHGSTNGQLAEAVDLTAESTQEPTTAQPTDSATDAATNVRAALLLLVVGAIAAAVLQ